METTTLSIIEPDSFKSLPGIVAGFSTRHGGTSESPYTSLNLGLSVGDDRDRVLENRRRLFEPLGFTIDQLAIAGQVHGHEIKEITEPGLFPGFDGMVTREPRILLAISAADCAAVLLADAEARVIGACHSGWRGTVARISARTVDAMERLGARRDHIHAYISPCISAEHFEVGPEVAEHFDAAFIHYQPDHPKPFIDMKGAITAQLQEAGVPAQAIEVSPICTYARTDTFFSHRAESGQTGRMMGFIALT